MNHTHYWPINDKINKYTQARGTSRSLVTNSSDKGLQLPGAKLSTYTFNKQRESNNMNTQHLSHAMLKSQGTRKPGRNNHLLFCGSKTSGVNVDTETARLCGQVLIF